jgi:hypothetical protein
MVVFLQYGVGHAYNVRAMDGNGLRRSILLTGNQTGEYA